MFVRLDVSRKCWFKPSGANHDWSAVPGRS